MDTREFEREMFRAAGIASHNFADAGSRSGADEGSGSGEPRQARVGDRCLGEGEEMDSQIFERELLVAAGLSPRSARTVEGAGQGRGHGDGRGRAAVQARGGVSGSNASTSALIVSACCVCVCCIASLSTCFVIHTQYSHTYTHMYTLTRITYPPIHPLHTHAHVRARVHMRVQMYASIDGPVSPSKDATPRDAHELAHKLEVPFRCVSLSGPYAFITYVNVFA